VAFDYPKQPWEKEIIGVDFSRRVPPGSTVLPVSVNITDVSLEETVSLSGAIASNYSPHISISSVTLTGVTGREKILVALISDGVSGFKYRLSFRITLSDNQRKEDDVWVIVKEV